MNTIQTKGATLEVLNLLSMTGISDDNLRRLIHNLVIELYKYQAESERQRIRERQQEGIELAFKLFLEGSTDKEVEAQTGVLLQRL